MMERFNVTITKAQTSTKDLIDKAASEIYRAALRHRVAVLTASVTGVIQRSVVVADCEEDKQYIDRICREQPDRLVGIYALQGRSHRELLSAITEDLEEVVYGVA